jgi:diguanylate cyclase (GGDEF)-like protein
MMEHSINPMLIPMMVTGLIFGYGAGIVTRLAVRPAICVTSLMVATIPTVIGFCARVANADGLYASAVFSIQSLLIAGFAIASLESVLDIYRTTCQQLIAKLDLAILARQDDLTGLPNRIQLRERFNEAGGRIREADDLLALHCLDLDHFKAVNDTFGHPMGDLLLKAVTKRLMQVIREGDTVARMGGDEFAILQTGIRHIDEARLLGLRVIRALSAPFKLDGHEICIGASIGVALAPRDGLNLEHLISCADEALYESKRAGRGNVILWKERCLNASTTAA